MPRKFSNYILIIFICISKAKIGSFDVQKMSRILNELEEEVVKETLEDEATYAMKVCRFCHVKKYDMPVSKQNAHIYFNLKPIKNAHF